MEAPLVETPVDVRFEALRGAKAHGLTFMTALRQSDDAGVTGRAVRGIETFVSLMDALVGEVPKGPATVLEKALSASGYVEELEADGGIEAEGRLENLSSSSARHASTRRWTTSSNTWGWWPTSTGSTRRTAPPCS
jgi:hypothetical protein